MYTENYNIIQPESSLVMAVFPIGEKLIAELLQKRSHIKVQVRQMYLNGKTIVIDKIDIVNIS